MTKTPPETNTLLDLLPGVVPIPDRDVLYLEHLPDNDALLGDDPDASFVESIRQLGVLQPIVVAEDRNAYTVIAGRRRIKASRKLKLTTIPAMIYHFHHTSFVDVVTLAENCQRKANPLCELEAIERLMKQGCGEKEIAKVTGMPVATIRKRKQLLRLHPDLRKKVALGQMAVSTASRVVKLSATEQAAIAEEEKVTASTVKEVRKRIATKATQALPDAMFDVQEETVVLSVPVRISQLKRLGANPVKIVQDLIEHVNLAGV